jgi:hypothetical protein
MHRNHRRLLPFAACGKLRSIFLRFITALLWPNCSLGRSGSVASKG